MIRSSLFSLLLLVTLPLATQPDDHVDTAAEQTQGGVSYRSGGIGDDESRELKGVRAQYPFDLTFSSPQEGRSVWESGVGLLITDGGGRTMLSLEDSGPLVLVKLPPGRYHLAATLKGRTLERDVTLAAGHRQVLSLQWPAATGSAP